MISTSHRHPSAPPVAYRGLNHSRMTALMETRLRDMPIAFLVLARLRRLVGDGQQIRLSGGVRGWARWLGCSPGYPKVILNRLAREDFLTVVYGDDGTAHVTVLPPVERRVHAGSSADHAASPASHPHDRTGPRSAPDHARTAPPRPRGRTVPPSCDSGPRSAPDRMSHDHESAQLSSQPVEGDSPHRPPPDDPVPAPLRTHDPAQAAPPGAPAPAPPAAPLPGDLSPAQQAVWVGLQARQIYPGLARAILAQHPTLTLAAFDQQVDSLAARGTYATPRFVVAKILARGETVAAPDPHPPAGPPRPRQPSDTIRQAGHVTDAIRQHWLDLCVQYPADTGQIVQAFLAQYPVPVEAL